MVYLLNFCIYINVSLRPSNTSVNSTGYTFWRFFFFSKVRLNWHHCFLVFSFSPAFKKTKQKLIIVKIHYQICTYIFIYFVYLLQLLSAEISFFKMFLFPPIITGHSQSQPASFPKCKLGESFWPLSATLVIAWLALTWLSLDS